MPKVEVFCVTRFVVNLYVETSQNGMHDLVRCKFPQLLLRGTSNKPGFVAQHVIRPTACYYIACYQADRILGCMLSGQLHNMLHVISPA